MVEKWLNEDYRSLPASLKEKVKKVKVAYWVALSWSEGSFERLITITRWLFWGFTHDDFYGPLPFNELQLVNNRTIEILQGAALTPQHNEVQAQLAIAREEMLPFASPSWIKRIERDTALFLEGMMEESYYNYRARLTYPPLNTYMDIREKTMFAAGCCSLVEISSDAVLPDEVYSHPVIRRITRLAGFMMGWVNDLFSAEKESRDKEVTNIVLVIKHEQKCSMEAAMEEAIRIHNTHLEEFIQLKSALPGFGVHNTLVKKYIAGLELMLSGHVIWPSYSKRY